MRARRGRSALLLASTALVAASALILPAPARAQQGPFVYVPNAGSNDVSIIDIPTQAPAGTVLVGIAPNSAAVRGDQSLVYVTNEVSNTVSVIDTASNTVTATINVSDPRDIAISPNASRLYVANEATNILSVIDTTNNTVIANVNVGIGPQGVAVSPDGSRVYVSNAGGNNVSVIDTANNTVTATINVGAGAFRIAVSPDGSRAYVTSFVGVGTVSVIDTASNTVTATITVGNQPFGVTISPDGSRVYVVERGNNTVSVIDTATNTVTATVNVGNVPFGVAVSPDGSLVYVSNAVGNTVSVIDGATNTVIATLPVGTAPFFPGICGNGNALLTAGNTFVAKQSGAIGCTGAGGPVFTGGTMQMAGAVFTSDLAVNVLAQGGTITGNVAGTGGLVKNGPGSLLLTDASTYTGATTVNAGTLVVDGSIASSILTTVNAGATLGGSGTVGNTTINGGTLAPGNSIGTITVNGNLTITAGSVYEVEVSPTDADRTNVTGTATLAGTVRALFEPGTYVARNYIILRAAGGLGGTTFGTLITDNLPANFVTSLSYTSTDVLLNLTANLGGGTPLNRNQRNVSGGINTAFNNGAALPAAFLPLFNLTGPSLGGALTQLSGEVAAGIQPASNLSVGMFLNTMLDPFVTGRNGTFGAATAYAPEQPSRAQDAFAAAMPVKAPPRPPTFEQRWSVWGSAYGGRSRIDGDAGVGSNDTTATAGGFAAGADYRVSSGLTLGAAVAIGETRWNTGSLGSGDSNLAQVGGYASARWNAFYLSGAVAGAWHNTDTSRTVTVSGFDRLEAGFDARAFGARIEGGWRHQLAGFGLTPYAAVQVQSVRTPAYSERVAAGSNTFALSYASQTATDTRTELGLWADTRQGLANGALVVLRGRAAWVHDFNPDTRINALFQTLPGSSFTVDGAAGPRDAALTSAVGELRLRNGISLIAKADGEFSSRAITYAGTGTIRYQW